MNLFKQITKKSMKNKPTNSNQIYKLNRRYFCFDEVGRGGLSIVYHGTDLYSEYFEKDSNLVIKIPSEDLLKKDDISAFVYSEYCFLRELNSDSIVKVLDFGIDKKTKIPYLVLDYIKGDLLSEISIDNINIKMKNKIFNSLMKTLTYIHSKNIIHADIAPSNIIIKDNYDAVVFDFGISQKFENLNNLNLEYKKIKAINPKYSAPELIKNDEMKPTFESDIFSLAVVLYELYSNKSLFDSTSLELDKKKIDFSSIPFFYRSWFKKALSKNPEKRKIKNKK